MRGTIQEEEQGNSDLASSEPWSPTILTALRPVPYSLTSQEPKILSLPSPQPAEVLYSQQNQVSWVWHQGEGSAYGHPVEVMDGGLNPLSHTVPKPQPPESLTHCFCLPEGVYNGATLGTNYPVVPQPGFRVDGFAHCAQHLQGCPAMPWAGVWKREKFRVPTRSQNTHTFSIPLPPPLFQVRTLGQ